MIAELPLKQRQVFAVSLLIILLLLTIMFLIKPFFSSYMGYGDRIDSLEQQIMTYQRLAEGLEQTEQDFEKLQQNNPLAEYYLPESKPALAAAGLQQNLNRAIRGSGGQVVSTKILNQSNDSPLLGVAIQAHLRLEIDQLVPLLHSLESGKPMLFIENFSVTANVRQARLTRQQRQRQQQQRQARQGNTRQKNQRVQNIQSMDVRFDLIGYAVKEPVL
ncbi:MAG: type II secretion system protein GspM [Amphritea sp.]